MIADVGSNPPFCRICGEQCGLRGTGCAYVYDDGTYADDWNRALRNPPMTTVRKVVFYSRPMLFPEIDESAVEPRPRRPPRPLVASPASFVGAGPMHRRWR